MRFDAISWNPEFLTVVHKGAPYMYTYIQGMHGATLVECLSKESRGPQQYFVFAVQIGIGTNRNLPGTASTPPEGYNGMWYLHYRFC